MEESNENVMRIILGQPYFIVGEHIKGKVQLNIVKNYPIHKLDIHFIGREKLVVYGKKFSHTITDTINILEENKADPELKTYIPKVLKPGIHEYPFALSSNFQNTKTPSTGSYHSYNISFESKYTLKAYVTAFGATEKSLKKKKKVELLEPLKSESGLEKFVDQEVKGLAFTKGNTGIHSWIDYSGFVLPAGMSIRVICFNNKCIKAVNRILIRLIQEAKTTFHIDTKPLIETDLVGEWVLHGAAAQKDVVIKRRLVVDHIKKAKELESCAGNLFEKSYSLTITPIYDMWICRMKPSVTYNLRVTKRLRGKEKSLKVVINEPNKPKKPNLNKAKREHENNLADAIDDKEPMNQQNINAPLL